jgi:xylulokinase
MLPGDYIAFKLTGNVGTTPSGLSEGILWDFAKSSPADFLLNHLGINGSLMPPVSPNCETFAEISPNAAEKLTIPKGVVVAYRAGDQPNNAFALNVLNPGEVAVNAGTSGVVYGVTEKLGVDPLSRVNNFLHVTSAPKTPRVGVLMCVNGTGSFYRWIRSTVAPDLSYEKINEIAEASPVGANRLIALPYGNGAERTLNNRIIGASLEGVDLNRHERSDIFRAASEGIAFALNYGMEIMKEMGLSPRLARAGFANMFQSDLFQRTFATITGVPLELYSTDGSEGAARGAGIGAGLYDSSSAFAGLAKRGVVDPDLTATSATLEAYQNWKSALLTHLS